MVVGILLYILLKGLGEIVFSEKVRKNISGKDFSGAGTLRRGSNAHILWACVPHLAGHPPVFQLLIRPERTYLQTLTLTQPFSCTNSSRIRDEISSRTLRNTASRVSSSPSAREGSGKDQCRRSRAPGKTGHHSLASSQTVMT